MLDSTYRHADEIINNGAGHSVYIGDCSAAEETQWLKQKNVRTVITAAAGFNHKYDSSIRHIKYDLLDSKTQNIVKYFDQAATQIDRNLRFGSVLVHCGAGVSRSTTIVIAYLIKLKGMTFASALKLCKSKRPQVCPNLGFELQLKSYQKVLQKSPKIAHFKEKFGSQLPELLKYQAYLKLNHTHNRSFFNMRQSLNRNAESTVSRNLRPEVSSKKQEQYIRKMAQFRFGITNMDKWKVTQQKLKRLNI